MLKTSQYQSCLPVYLAMLHRFFSLISLAAFFAALGACTPEEEVFKELGDEPLYFSTDTLRFDTLLTTQQSPSYRVLLHNPNKNGLIIPALGLQAADSPYELTINGQAGTRFTNLRILGEDSLLILVKTRLPETGNAEPQLRRDYLELAGSGHPFVVIEAWGQDATFYKGLFVIEENTVWNSAIPYVIEDSLFVGPKATLTILKGVHVVMRPGSRVLVAGSLVTQGSPGSQVVFRNERTDERYRNAPGQWGGILFFEGSKNNSLDQTIIKNAEIGLYIGTPDDDEEPDVTIANSVIANMSSDGILAFTSDVYCYNSVIYNAARHLAGHYAGGNYRYEHCTFSNFPNDFFREDPAVIFTDNLLLPDEQLLVAPLTASIFNSVVWGSQAEELVFNTEGGAPFFYQVGNSLLRSANKLLDVGNNKLNVPPKFVNEFMHDYRPDSLSPLIDAGAARAIRFDIAGYERDSTPDIGAFEWQPGQEGEN